MKVIINMDKRIYNSIPEKPLDFYAMNDVEKVKKIQEIRRNFRRNYTNIDTDTQYIENILQNLQNENETVEINIYDGSNDILSLCIRYCWNLKSSNINTLLIYTESDVFIGIRMTAEIDDTVNKKQGILTDKSDIEAVGRLSYSVNKGNILFFSIQKGNIQEEEKNRLFQEVKLIIDFSVAIEEEKCFVKESDYSENDIPNEIKIKKLIESYNRVNENSATVECSENCFERLQIIPAERSIFPLDIFFR